MPQCDTDNMQTRLVIVFVLMGAGLLCQITVFFWYCWIFFIRSENKAQRFSRASMIYAVLILMFPIERMLRCLHLYFQFYGSSLITNIIHQSCNTLMALTALLVVLAQLQRLKSCFEDSVYSISDKEYLRLLCIIVTGVLSMILWSILSALRSIIGMSQIVGSIIVIGFAVLSVICLSVSLARMNYAFGVRLKWIVAKDTVNHIEFDPLPSPPNDVDVPVSALTRPASNHQRKSATKSPNSLSTTMITPVPSLAGTSAQSGKINVQSVRPTVTGVSTEAEVTAGRTQALSLSMTVSRTISRNNSTNSGRVILSPQSSVPKLEIVDTVSGDDLPTQLAASDTITPDRRTTNNSNNENSQNNRKLSQGNRSTSDVFDRASSISQRYRRYTSNGSSENNNSDCDNNLSHHRKGSTLDKIKNASILNFDINQRKFLETAAKSTVVCIWLTVAGIIVFISSVFFMLSDCLHILIFVAHVFVGFSGFIVSLVMLLSFTQTDQEYHYCCDLFHSLVVRIVAYETDEQVDQFVRNSLVPIPLK